MDAMTYQDAYDRLDPEARREAFIKMHRALDGIAASADPALPPGHVEYASKSQIQARAKAAVPNL